MTNNKKNNKALMDLTVRPGVSGAAGSKNEQGVALILALIMLTLLGMLGAFALSTSTTEIRISSNYRTAQNAYYNGDQGREFLNTNPAVRSQIAVGKVFPAQGAGNYITTDLGKNKNYNIINNLPTALPSGQGIVYKVTAYKSDPSKDSGTTAEMGQGSLDATAVGWTIIGIGPNRAEFAIESMQLELGGYK
jgi:hypothetical protein